MYSSVSSYRLYSDNIDFFHFLYLYMYVCLCRYVCMGEPTCMYVYLCVHLYMRVCMYVLSGVDSSVGQPQASKPEVPGSTPDSLQAVLEFLLCL